MQAVVEKLGEHAVKEAPVREHTNTYILGTSVLAMKYREGVLILTDMQGSYGSYAKYKHLPKVAKLSDDTLLASSGEYSNFQEMVHYLRTEIAPSPDEECLFGPRECFEIIKNHMYEKRNKGAPEQNYHVIAGMESEEKETLPYEKDEKGRFLAAVDRIGNFYHANVIATGIGAHIALPFLRAGCNDGDIDENDAHSLLIRAATILAYRDCRASSTVQISKVTRDNIFISDPIKLSTNWTIGQH